MSKYSHTYYPSIWHFQQTYFQTIVGLSEDYFLHLNFKGVPQWPNVKYVFLIYWQFQS